ncbi:hypothetical protein FRB91_003902 [Serendipita sp. 411]|nr:hypothetical protein FRB91_003902 [Serendipita sp. 411]KAG9053262.1 hypothetical protein FS842_008421 [Serendipita sp. 407]
MSILGCRQWARGSFDTRGPLSLILDAQNLAAKTDPRVGLKSFEIIGGPSFPGILDNLWVSINTTCLLFRRVLPCFSNDTNNLTDLRMVLSLVTSDYLEHIFTSLPHLQSLELELENDTVPVSIPSRALERIKLPKLSTLIASKVIVDAVLPTWIAVPSLKTLGLVVEIEKEGGTATRTLYDCLRSYGADWPVLHTVILKGMWTEGMMNFVRDAFTEALSMVRTLEIEGNGFSSLFEHLAQSTLLLSVVNQLVLRDTDVSSSSIRQFVNARQDAGTGSNPIRGLTITGRNSLDRSLCEEMEERLNNVNVYW